MANEVRRCQDARLHALTLVIVHGSSLDGELVALEFHSAVRFRRHTVANLCTHIASVLKTAIGVAYPLMCMYKSHTKKCDGNALMIVPPSPAPASLRVRCPEGTSHR
jgi:hypothetical protein